MNMTEEERRKSHVKAVAKHHAEKTDLIQIRVKKGEKERLKAEAAKRGKTLTSIFREAIEREFSE